MQINIRTDTGAVRRALEAIPANLERRVIPPALNKVGAKARTEMNRRIAADYAMKSADIRSRLRLARANRKDFTLILDPFAGSRRRSLNLIRFLEKKVTLAEAKRRRKSGTLSTLRFQIKRGAGAKAIKNAFIGNKGRTVFQRVGRDRLPIKALSTIDVPAMFNTRRINSAVVARIRQELPIELTRAMTAVLAGSIRGR